MKWLKWAWIPVLLGIAALCFAADSFFDGFDGTVGQHVSGWYDNANPGQSPAGGGDFLYAANSEGDVVTVSGSNGYGEVYKDFILVDTSVYKYLQVKVDAISNTLTTWQLGVNTMDPDTWLGNVSHVPCADPNTSTGFYSFDISGLMPGPQPHHFLVQLTVSGLLIDTGTTDEWGGPIYDYWGVDGSTVSFDYVRLSDSAGPQATPTPSGGTPVPTATATPTPRKGRGYNFVPVSHNSTNSKGWNF